MSNKGLLILFFAILIAGTAVAQTEDTQTETDMKSVFGTQDESAPQQAETVQYAEKTPQNTITADIGPLIIGIGMGVAGKMLSGDEEGLSSSGFGIGLQYERQLFDKFSVAGRFAYLGGGIGYSEDGSALGMKLSSFSLEAHARFFPGKTRRFFLDGMLGYANMAVAFDGTFLHYDGYKENVDFKVSRGFFKLGGKLGWRIDFGKPGGFTFEPSLGFYGGVGMGDTLGKQLSKKLDDDVTDLDEIFSLVEKFILIGGPRLSLAFGWRF